MFSTPTKGKSENNPSMSVLALSPIGLRKESSSSSNNQVLYGSSSPAGLNAAVVLYDFEQHALVARQVKHVIDHSDQGREEETGIVPVSGKRICPLCNTDLSTKGTPFVSDAYFATLTYFHKQLRDTSNESSLSEAVRALSDLSASLMVNGYYSRFFKEINKLGSGSFGSVFLCNHVIDSVPLGEFAVKKVPVGDSREWLRGIMKEVKALERLASHPNIVAYKHSWLEMDRANAFCPYVPYLYILMSYCDSGALDNLLWPAGSLLPVPLSEIQIWSLFLDIAQGMQHLHRNLVLHRDLKPSNILLSTNTSSDAGIKAVLSDFGTAEILSPGSSSHAIHSGFTGTVEYTAPEVLSNQIYSEASDMWSLGIVLYALCFNAVPISDRDPKTCADLICKSNTASLPSIPERNSELTSLISALTAKDPAKRPSCDDLLFHPFIRQKIHR